MLVVGGMNLVHSLGMTKRELIPLATAVNVANNSGLSLLCGILITITGKNKHGNTRETRQLCYISEMVFTLYLTEQACEDLGIIEKEFISIGRLPEASTVASSGTSTRTCSCPPRATPTTMPYILVSAPLQSAEQQQEDTGGWEERLILKPRLGLLRSCTLPTIWARSSNMTGPLTPLVNSTLKELRSHGSQEGRGDCPRLQYYHLYG